MPSHVFQVCTTPFPSLPPSPPSSLPTHHAVSDFLGESQAGRGVVVDGVLPEGASPHQRRGSAGVVAAGEGEERRSQTHGYVLGVHLERGVEGGRGGREGGEGGRD